MIQQPGVILRIKLLKDLVDLIRLVALKHLPEMLHIAFSQLFFHNRGIALRVWRDQDSQGTLP
jgi:hypothetical protein